VHMTCKLSNITGNTVGHCNKLLKIIMATDLFKWSNGTNGIHKMIERALFGHNNSSSTSQGLIRKDRTLWCSVAEPEPVKRQLFAGAGAQVFWPRFGSEYVNSYKMLPIKNS
jgi:hypothetical protein